MSRQIVVCLDGTWNNPVEQTNVYRLFEMLAGEEQRVEESGPIRSHLVRRNEDLLAYYLQGIGRGGRLHGLLGRTHGITVHDSVIDAYLLVSQVYRRGDKIWIFGFSRGAWAARTLGAFIARSGLIPGPEADDDDSADNAERIWLNYKEGLGLKRGGRFWRYHDEVPIRMIGVWDTVGENGVPEFNGLHLVDREELGLMQFSDRELSPRVEHGRQALAIDEERADFAPTLWTAREGVRQVWFAGAHADVGGGYEHRGLSDVALEWMIGEVNALDAGLRLLPDPLDAPLEADCLADRHDETRGPIWRSRPQKERRVPEDAELHESVLERLRERFDYRPKALEDLPVCAGFFEDDERRADEQLQQEREELPFRKLPVDGATRFPVHAHKWWNASGVEVDVGERYRIAASGTWLDRGVPANADGYESDGWLHHLTQGSRRLEERPWFSLVAAVHPLPDLEASNPASENMLTGLLESTISGVARIDDESSLIATPDGCEIEIIEPGFLYFFANDSAFAYADNRGFLSVEVTRLPWSAAVEQRVAAAPDAVPGSLVVKLYFAPGTSSLAAHIALREAGLDFDLVRVDLRAHRLADGSDFRLINPKGYVPALELEDGSVLTEVPAIVQYIADRVPESGLAPQPFSRERYRLEEWLAFISSELHQRFAALFFPDTPDSYAQSIRDDLAARLGHVAASLEERDYLLGERFTVADAYLFAVLAWSGAVGVDLGRWPVLVAFLDRVGNRQSVREARAAED
ncbi:glutathione transferase GstA [Accumulibacter sp.]|uniref:glutathione transferase GstA n=1 Tax=Accumulibacter sp. TaxID=2053492 RepID=UPI00287A258D|nr:glutathione transferase GstA [Accumulibacter sp.]MDS4048837.1 glutathione transferase GstA [Accumulibacter sp.]